MVGRWAGLLREACEGARHEAGGELSLDLSAVGSADREGVALLRDLRKSGVRCACLSPLVRELMEE